MKSFKRKWEKSGKIYLWFRQLFAMISTVCRARQSFELNYLGKLFQKLVLLGKKNHFLFAEFFLIIFLSKILKTKKKFFCQVQGFNQIFFFHNFRHCSMPFQTNLVFLSKPPPEEVLFGRKLRKVSEFRIWKKIFC